MEAPVWIDYGTFFISIFMALVAIAATMVSYFVLVESTSPEVIVYLEQNPDAKTVFNLVIKNIGNGAAKNVSFYPQSPLPQEAFGFEDASPPPQMDHGPIITGIPYMAPGATRTIMLGQFHSLEKWLKSKSIDIKIVCERSSKRVFSSNKVITSSSLDVYSFSGVEASDNSHAKGIHDELGKINEEIKKIRTALSSLRES